MRIIGNNRVGLMAAAMIAARGAGTVAMPAPRKGSARAHRPTPPRLDTAQAREIAEHNAAVDRRKAEKKAAKLARRIAGPNGAFTDPL
jgi:hypothetical protein